jgi:hypothetical protein
MSSPLSSKQWIIVVLVNIVVSAVTTLIVVRVLIDQPRAGTAGTGAPVEQQAEVIPATATPLAEPSTTPASASTAAGQAPAPTATPSRVAPTNAATATQTRAPTPVAQGAVSVRISAVLYPGQRQREVVVVVNEGAEVVMKGWSLSSSRGISYTFGNVTLFRDSFISLHTTAGSDVPTDMFMNRAEPAWQAGDTLTLSNQDQKVATFTVK